MQATRALGSTTRPKAKDLQCDYEALLVLAQDRGSLEDILPTIRILRLLYAGEMDPVCPAARKWASQMVNVEFVSLPGLDHGGAITRSDLVLPHIKEFLARASRDS